MNNFLLKILVIDSTTGSEAKLANYILKNFKPRGAKTQIQKINSKQKNLFFKWGAPKIIFCTHLDTVPPHIPPRKKGNTIYGRGAVDAKGQIATMLETCNQLYKENQNDFGLLLLAGEETDSIGAKVANKLIKGSKYVIVGEPTDEKLIKAAKGILLAEVTISGKSAHSGYPEKGIDAIEKLRLFLNKLYKLKLPTDKTLGKTNYNIGELQSSNATNVISDKVTCKILFRTTFTSHDVIKKLLNSRVQKDSGVTIKYINESPPMEFFTVPGFKKGIAAFGSDAPKLNKLGKPLLYGPGNILNAHTDKESIKTAEVKRAAKNLKILYYKLMKTLAKGVRP